MTALQTASRKKLHELLDLIREVDERRYGPEWGIESQGDVADGHRNLMHLLEGGLFSHFDADPERPVFRRIEVDRIADPQVPRRQRRCDLLRCGDSRGS